MKPSLILSVMILAVGLGLTYAVSRERTGRPRLTVLVPSNYCGELAVYFAYNAAAGAAKAGWERAVAVERDGEALLVKLPFRESKMNFSLVGSIDGPALRIDRMSVSSWKYGAIYHVLAGNIDCLTPSVRSHEQNQADQRMFELQME